MNLMMKNTFRNIQLSSYTASVQDKEVRHLKNKLKF